MSDILQYQQNFMAVRMLHLVSAPRMRLHIVPYAGQV